MEKRKRVLSGIEGYNGLLGGGFESNSINLIVGGSGSGKTIFAMHFLIEGIKKGENGLYITFEEQREEFFLNMLEIGWDLEKLEKEKKFVFLEYSPEKIRNMLEEGGGVIESIVLKNNIKRIVIDSITSFALLFESELEKREAALSLFEIIRKWNCTSILTLEEDPENKGGSSSSLEFEADSITLIYFMREGERRKRLVEVLKMRGTKHSTEVHEFEITPKGIVIKKPYDMNKLSEWQ
jgi:circadian clock protein KaiC